MSRRKDVRRGMMVVPISGLDERDYPIEFEASSQELGLDQWFTGPINVIGTLSRVVNQYQVTGEISATYESECDRCLNPISRSLDLPFSLHYQITSESPEEEESEATDEVIPIAPDEHAILLDPEIVQTLKLAIPMKNLCRDECRGLCTQCGADLNSEPCSCQAEPVDARWEKLRGLFPSDSEEN